jgi:predicted GIY-YIG superfamily endonuclease
MTTRFIYILSNPITQETFYVGTTSCLRDRRRQHYKKYGHLFYGLPPVLTVVDVIKSDAFFIGLGLERYWINYYKSIGANLINIKHKDIDFNVDYFSYRKMLCTSNSLNYHLIPKRILEAEAAAA